jgi:hypothetical protein
MERTPGSAQNHHQSQYDTFEGLLGFQQCDEAAGRVEVKDEFGVGEKAGQIHQFRRRLLGDPTSHTWLHCSRIYTPANQDGHLGFDISCYDWSGHHGRFVSHVRVVFDCEYIFANGAVQAITDYWRIGLTLRGCP